MTVFDYRAFYEQAGALNGWDFGKVSVSYEGQTVDLFAEARARLDAKHLLLDIGTGGGEAVLPLADRVHMLAGIDASEAMIRTARRNLAASGKRNVRFFRMEAESLRFPDGFFDMVTCRHSEFDAREAARVLAEGGLFMTQQVGEADRRNIKEWFGRGQSSPERSGELLARYEAELAEAGFTDIRTYESDTDVYFRGAEDLLFMLKHTPTIPDFGASARDFELLASFVEANRTDKGIRTNASRFMIMAKR